MNQLAPNALTRPDMEIRAGEGGDLPNTFVDGRNLLFLSFAAIFAKHRGGTTTSSPESARPISAGIPTAGTFFYVPSQNRP